MPFELIKTGVPGLDNILKGGLRRNSTVLITGGPGTGKTILAMQYIYFGARDFNENGIFIVTEENLELLRQNAMNLGMNIKGLEAKRKIFLLQKPITALKGGIASIKGLIDAIKKYDIKRVALDSMTFFDYLYPKYGNDKIEFRRQVMIFLEQIKKTGVTFLGVSQKSYVDLDRLRYSMLDFVFEGFIVLSRARKGSYFERLITVAKIRGQEHSLDIYPVVIGDDGLKVLYDQTPFSLVEKEEQGFK